MDTKAKIALGVGGAVIALGAAVGVGALAANLAGGTDTAAAQPTTSQDDGSSGSGRGNGQRGGFDTSELAATLAEKLGVEEAKVKAALEEVTAATRPSGQPSGAASGQPSGAPSGQPTAVPSGRPSGDPGGDRSGMVATMAKALAEKLDLDEAKVLAALQEAMAANRPSDAPSAQPTK